MKHAHERAADAIAGLSKMQEAAKVSHQNLLAQLDARKFSDEDAERALALYHKAARFQLYYDPLAYVMPTLTKMYAGYVWAQEQKTVKDQDPEITAEFVSDLISFLAEVYRSLPVDSQLYRELAFN